MLALFNDALDDVPVKEQSERFVGMDAASKPTLLAPGAIRNGRNMWMDVDGLIRTRPGLRFNSLSNTLPIVGGTKQIQGAGYFDTVGREAILTIRNGKLYEIPSADNAATATYLAGPAPSTSADVVFAQLVDRMFYTDGTIRWSLYSAGWTHGTVTAFSDASAMPTWRTIVAHKFRLLAVDADGIKIYASAIGEAYQASNWVKTENFRVGTGEGDPIRAVLSSQSGKLIVLTERAAWQVDTSNATVANWTADKITGLTGCVEGKTAVEIGQDTYFLSRYGVVSLGGLADNISINAAATLSSPIQSLIDRINWTYISTAWATTWRDLYLLALPIDSDTSPTLIVPFNTRTRAWAPPWTATLETADLGGGNTAAFSGWARGLVSRFGSKQETLLADTCGRLLRLDDSYTKDENAAADTNEIISWATLRAHVFGSEEAFKQGFWLEVDWFNSTGADVQINLVRDGLKAYPDKTLVNCDIIASGLGTNAIDSFPMLFPIVFQANETYRKSWGLRQFNRFREASIQLVSQQGAMKIRTVRVAAFVDTPALTR